MSIQALDATPTLPAFVRPYHCIFHTKEQHLKLYATDATVRIQSSTSSLCAELPERRQC